MSSAIAEANKWINRFRRRAAIASISWRCWSSGRSSGIGKAPTEQSLAKLSMLGLSPWTSVVCPCVVSDKHSSFLWNWLLAEAVNSALTSRPFTGLCEKIWSLWVCAQVAHSSRLKQTKTEVLEMIRRFFTAHKESPLTRQIPLSKGFLKVAVEGFEPPTRGL